MLTVLRQRNFALLWLANLISVAGDWVLLFALPFAIYELTGSALATGAMFMAGTVPRVLFGSVAGVFVDRWDRRRTAVVADLGRVVILLPLLLLRSGDWLWVVFLVGFLESTLAQFAMPAKTALLPALVRDDQLPAANALLSLNQEINRLIGPLVGALLLTWTGLLGVVLVDSASFLLSGLLISLVAAPARVAAARPPTDGQPAVSPWRLVGREWRAGLDLARGDRTIAAIFILFGMAMMAEGLFNIVLIPFVKDVLGGGPLELGWIMAAQAVGGLLGGLAIGRWGHQVAPRRIVPVGAATLAVVIISLATAPPLLVVLPLATLAGLAAMGFFLTLFALLQRVVVDAYRGRVFGAFMTSSALLTLLGQGVAGLLADRLGPAAVLALGGGLYLLAAPLARRLLAGQAGSAPAPAPVAERSATPAEP